MPQALSLKQRRFAKAFAISGNATGAARLAGYSPKTSSEMGYENLRKPQVRSEIEREVAAIEADFSPQRVRRRLDELSYAAQGAGQFGPATRCEELIGKSIGMWIDQSIALSGQLKDEHIQALLKVAQRRQQEPIELQDDASHNLSHSDDDRG